MAPKDRPDALNDLLPLKRSRQKATSNKSPIILIAILLVGAVVAAVQ